MLVTTALQQLVANWGKSYNFGIPLSNVCAPNTSLDSWYIYTRLEFANIIHAYQPHRKLKWSADSHFLWFHASLRKIIFLSRHKSSSLNRYYKWFVILLKCVAYRFKMCKKLCEDFIYNKINELKLIICFNKELYSSLITHSPLNEKFYYPQVTSITNDLPLYWYSAGLYAGLEAGLDCRVIWPTWSFSAFSTQGKACRVCIRMSHLDA